MSGLTPHEAYLTLTGDDAPTGIEDVAGDAYWWLADDGTLMCRRTTMFTQFRRPPADGTPAPAGNPTPETPGETT